MKITVCESGTDFAKKDAPSIHSSRLRSNAAVKRRRAGSCARTICVVPVMPPAPGRFSITTGWPSALARLLLMARMEPSAPEPADSGRMMRRGRSPRLWARTRPTGASAAAPKAAAPKHRARRRTGDASAEDASLSPAPGCPEPVGWKVGVVMVLSPLLL